MGARAGHRRVRDRPRPLVGHGVRGRRRGRGDLDRCRRDRSRPDRASRAAGRRGPTGELLAHPRGRTGRSVLGDLRRSRREVRTRWWPRCRRGTVHGDLEPGVHPGPGRREPGDRRRAPGEEHRHRLEPRTGRDPAPGEGQLLRDRCVPTALRGGRVTVRQAPRRGSARRRLAQGDRRARARHHVPDRRRRPALERGPRLHPAPDAPPRGHALAPTRHRGCGHGAAHPPHDRALGRRVSRASRERVVRVAGGDVGGGPVRGDAPPGAAAVREGGRTASRGARSWRATTRSSCPTRSGSRCS